MMLYGGPGPPAVTLLAFGRAYGPLCPPDPMTWADTEGMAAAGGAGSGVSRRAP